MQWYNLQGPSTARASRHVPYVPQWLIRPCLIQWNQMNRHPKV